MKRLSNNSYRDFTNRQSHDLSSATSLVFEWQARQEKALATAQVLLSRIELEKICLGLSRTKITRMKIEKIAAIQGLTLLVYYTNAHCWQFAAIATNNQSWQSQEIFYTAAAAESAGKKWIKAMLR